MKTGTKSLLFGCHQIILHPLFVLVAWIKLYGWKTLSWPIVLSIIIHDWGFWGCEKMDDEKGERHPVLAARIMEKLYPYDRVFTWRPYHADDAKSKVSYWRAKWYRLGTFSLFDRKVKYHVVDNNVCGMWYMPNFVRYHSRFLAKKEKEMVSPLCLADKLGTGLMPTWLWVILGKLSGEINEYMEDQKYEINQVEAVDLTDARRRGNHSEFFKQYKILCDKWVSGEELLEPWYE